MFLIEYLDEDDEFPRTHLVTVIDRYPRIKRNLYLLNSACFHLASATFVFVIINFISSAIYLINKVFSKSTTCCPDITHKSVKTVTTLITNTLLVTLKLIRELNTTRRSKISTMGISSMHMLPLAYNVIDHDHIGDDGLPPLAEGEVRPSAFAQASVRISAMRRHIKHAHQSEDVGGIAMEVVNSIG